MNQLDKAIAEDHFARRRCQILADNEGIRRNHLDIFSLGIPLEVFPAGFQTFALGCHKTFHRHRVKPEEIRRRDHIQPITQPEGRTPALLVG